MVQPQILSMIRAATERFLTQRCTIDRETSAVGDFGEPLHAREVVYSSEPCRLIQVGRRTDSGVSVTAGAETLQHDYRLIVRRSVALTTDMRVTVEGLTYNIVRLETEWTDDVFHAAILARVE